MAFSRFFAVCLFFTATISHSLAWGTIYDPETAYKTAVSSGKPTLLEFGAPWCKACSHTLPVIEALTREKKYMDRLNVVVINIDDNDNLRTRYRINSIPVQILLDGTGKEIKRHFGAVDKKQLDTMLNELMIPGTARK